MAHHTRLEDIANHHMYDQKQGADQHAFVNPVEQQRLQHGRDGGNHRANIGYIVKQECQHAPHQRKLNAH
ncbi:hypothetical protein D3C81_2144430 [compost metagenome]